MGCARARPRAAARRLGGWRRDDTWEVLHVETATMRGNKREDTRQRHAGTTRGNDTRERHAATTGGNDRRQRHAAGLHVETQYTSHVSTWRTPATRGDGRRDSPRGDAYEARPRLAATARGNGSRQRAHSSRRVVHPASRVFSSHESRLRLTRPRRAARACSGLASRSRVTRVVMRVVRVRAFSTRNPRPRAFRAR
jgi:hypothetical protein